MQSKMLPSGPQGELTKAAKDRGWPHQVAVPASDVVGARFHPRMDADIEPDDMQAADALLAVNARRELKRIEADDRKAL